MGSGYYCEPTAKKNSNKVLFSVNPRNRTCSWYFSAKTKGAVVLVFWIMDTDFEESVEGVS